ncbi:tripartite tricarboxylate transporter substrate binding protein [Salinibacterium sp. ZJ454]|uniref:Bug family tripartite tricarboxylate transporter substrate binding protein n=1 Tax=Salinibacterium sp. ZJ454 TaxID=2708339 RepID=UPI001421355D|nr:tripartite tricarboxylate transporter substrate binding protein [Salinibacterium sp. ZJ454]
MKATTRRRGALAGTGLALSLALALTGCGNVTTASEPAEGDSYPTGPVTLTVGQSAGGSSDLIARAVAEHASDALGVAVPVVNKPGANGALATLEVASAKPDGQTLILLNASLFAITPLAVPESEAVSLDDVEVVAGISQDDYVLLANVDSGYQSIDDLKNAGKAFNFGTTGVGTGSQLAQSLVFKAAGIEGTDIPFDGGSPALVALLGNQVDLTVVQLGEAMPQIEAGKVTPIVVFSAERNQYLKDVPTATEEGYDVIVSQFRAIGAPKGTPEPILKKLREAFAEGFATDTYQDFNKQGLFTPAELDADKVVSSWTAAAKNYKSLTEEYGISMGGGN